MSGSRIIYFSARPDGIQARNGRSPYILALFRLSFIHSVWILHRPSFMVIFLHSPSHTLSRISPNPNLALDPEYGTTSISNMSATDFSNLLPRLRLFLFLVFWSIAITPTLVTTGFTSLGFRKPTLLVVFVLIAGNCECLAAINTLLDHMCHPAILTAFPTAFRKLEALLLNMFLECEADCKFLAAIHTGAINHPVLHVTSPILDKIRRTTTCDNGSPPISARNVMYYALQSPIRASSSASLKSTILVLPLPACFMVSMMTLKPPLTNFSSVAKILLMASIFA